MSENEIQADPAVETAIASEASESSGSESNAETLPVVATIVDAQQKLMPVKKGRQMLRQLETTISRGIKDFWVVGESLMTIRDEGLFRLRYSGEDYKTFGDYLDARWGYSRGYQLLKAAKVRRTMIDIGIRNPDAVCTSERQYRECGGLLKVASEPETLEQLQDAIKSEKKLTKDLLSREIGKLLPPPKARKVKAGNQEKRLERKLKKLKANIETSVKQIRADYPEQGPAIDSWLESLAKL